MQPLLLKCIIQFKNMKPLVIITASVHPFLIDTLTEKGFSILHLPSITYEELEKKIENAVGLIVTTRIKLDAAIIEKAKQLKWIGRLGSGMELIDVSFAQQKGIACVSSPEGNCTAVGEHSLGLLLNLMHRIHSAYAEVKNKQWIRDANRGVELTGKKVGIIGYGHTGAAFAKVLSGFDVTILAHDIHKVNFAIDNIREASLAEIQAEADVISLHLPLTSLTHHYANDAFFEKLKKQPYFISTCRGEVSSTEAILHALKNKKISGAALDVLANEDLATYTAAENQCFNALIGLPNFLLTPHIAGYTKESYYKMSLVLLEKLGLF